MCIQCVATCTCTHITYMCMIFELLLGVYAVSCSCDGTDDGTGDRVDTGDAVGCCLPEAYICILEGKYIHMYIYMYVCTHEHVQTRRLE